MPPPDIAPLDMAALMPLDMAFPLSDMAADIALPPMLLSDMAALMAGASLIAWLIAGASLMAWLMAGALMAGALMFIAIVLFLF
jgi:hypothetical protein